MVVRASGAMKRFKWLKNKCFLIGMTSGVVLSLLVMPFLEDCHTRTPVESSWYQQIIDNDYDPVVKISVKPNNLTQQSMAKFTRPKFYASELDVKDNLLVAILTGKETIDTLASAVNGTLTEYADKLIFLVETVNLELDLLKRRFQDDSVHLLAINQVPNKVAQQPKYLQVINHLFDKNLVNSFNFVFIASDKTYVNGENLLKFVSSVSMSQAIFATSFGDRLAEEINDDVMLQAGVLLSCSLLLKCNSDAACLNKFHNKFSNPLKTSFTSQRLTNNLDSQILNQNSLESTYFLNSMTTYPVTTINLHHQLNLLSCQNSLNKTLGELRALEDEIAEINQMVDSSWPFGVLPSSRPLNRFDVIRWSFFNESHSFMPNEFDVIAPLNDLQQLEVADIESRCIRWLLKKYKHIMENQIKIINFYKKFDALRGLEYIVDVRIVGYENFQRLQVIKPLNKVELVPDVPYVTENIRIILVLPVRSTEEIESVSSFLHQYANVCLRKQSHQTILLLILIYQSSDSGDVYGHIKVEASQLQNKYKSSGAKIAWISLISAKTNQVPSEIAYLDLMTRKLFSSFTNALILHCRSNIILSVDFLNRVRLNTISGYQIFNPIPFVEFRLRSQIKPLKNFDVRKDNGYFDTTNFNFVSFYLSDYLSARKAIQSQIPILRIEQDLVKDIYYNSNVDVFELFMKFNLVSENNSKLFIMRGIEPDLRVKHENFAAECERYESNRFSLENCQRKNVIGLGTKSQLAELILDDDRRNVQENDEENSIF